MRQAKEEDLQNNLLNLYIDGYNLHYNEKKDFFRNRSDEELKENLASAIRNPLEFVMVHEIDGVIRGYFAFHTQKVVKQVMWIDELVIDKDYRGKGIGTQFMAEIEKIAGEMGCQRIELNCWCFNNSAMKFYKKIGFVEQRITFGKNIEAKK